MKKIDINEYFFGNDSKEDQIKVLDGISDNALKRITGKTMCRLTDVGVKHRTTDKFGETFIWITDLIAHPFAILTDKSRKHEIIVAKAVIDKKTVEFSVSKGPDIKSSVTLPIAKLLDLSHNTDKNVKYFDYSTVPGKRKTTSVRISKKLKAMVIRSIIKTWISRRPRAEQPNAVSC